MKTFLVILCAVLANAVLAARQKLLDQLKSVTPKVMTPLTASMMKAGELLAGGEEKGS